jgi:hypothetical protein
MTTSSSLSTWGQINNRRTPARPRVEAQYGQADAELAIDPYADSLLHGPSNSGVAAIIDELPYVELFPSTNCQFGTVGNDPGEHGLAGPRRATQEHAVRRVHADACK